LLLGLDAAFAKLLFGPLFTIIAYITEDPRANNIQVSDSVTQWSASRFVAREVVSSTLPWALGAQRVVTAWAAINYDSCHEVALGILLTHRGYA